jgi:hypothetical protein
MLTPAQFRIRHAHAVASHPEAAFDVVIQEEIEIAGEEYFFGDLSDIMIDRLTGFIVCHRLQIAQGADGCGAVNQLAGRLLEIGTDIERLKSNAKASDDPFGWRTTACGAQFKQWLDNSSMGIQGIHVHSGCCNVEIIKNA